MQLKPQRLSNCARSTVRSAIGKLTSLRLSRAPSTGPTQVSCTTDGLAAATLKTVAFRSAIAILRGILPPNAFASRRGCGAAPVVNDRAGDQGPTAVPLSARTRHV